MSPFDNKPLKTFFKTWAKNLGLAENVVFHKKKYGSRIFFPEVTKPFKWQKTYDLGSVG